MLCVRVAVCHTSYLCSANVGEGPQHLSQGSAKFDFNLISLGNRTWEKILYQYCTKLMKHPYPALHPVMHLVT